jgi:hypothetical protein
MKIKKLSSFILALLFLLIFSVSIGCSKQKEGTALMEKIKNAEKAMGKTNTGKSTEDPLHEKYMATIEQCSEKYESCLEKCAKKSNDKCDNKCVADLSLCEKDLPNDLKTMK